MNEIPFSFDGVPTKPVDEAAPVYPAPSQTADGEEYICGDTGNAHPYANPGRDQDRSRADEYNAAQGCSRYVS